MHLPTNQISGRYVTLFQVIFADIPKGILCHQLDSKTNLHQGNAYAIFCISDAAKLFTLYCMLVSLLFIYNKLL